MATLQSSLLPWLNALPAAELARRLRGLRKAEIRAVADAARAVAADSPLAPLARRVLLTLHEQGLWR